MKYARIASRNPQIYSKYRLKCLNEVRKNTGIEAALRLQHGVLGTIGSQMYSFNPLGDLLFQS
jgi:hypothetical protein